MFFFHEGSLVEAYGTLLRVLKLLGGSSMSVCSCLFVSVVQKVSCGHVRMALWYKGFRMLEFYKLGINFFQRPTGEVSAATACLQRSVLRRGRNSI